MRGCAPKVVAGSRTTVACNRARPRVHIETITRSPKQAEGGGNKEQRTIVSVVGGGVGRVVGQTTGGMERLERAAFKKPHNTC